MKTTNSEKKASAILLVIMFTVLTQLLSFCQTSPTPSQKPQEKSQVQTSTQASGQTAAIKAILSKYDASALTAADAKAIHERFREAGIHAGPETKDAIIAAGFDPDKLRDLDPPKNQQKVEKSATGATGEKMANVQEKIIKPLALSVTQNEVLTKAFTEFYAEVEGLKKARANPQEKLDKSKVEPLVKTRDEKIRLVLSKEQFVKYQELEKASRPPKPDNSELKKN